MKNLEVISLIRISYFYNIYTYHNNTGAYPAHKSKYKWARILFSSYSQLADPAFWI
jgi:hypothetical protein